MQKNLKTKCPKGHDYTIENSYLDKKGYRRCKECLKLHINSIKEKRSLGIKSVKKEITHCPHGHEYTPENSYFVTKTGVRYCKKCNNIKTKKFKENNPQKYKKCQKDYVDNNREKLLTYWKKYNLKKYNLSLEDYNNLLEKQNYVCAICKNKCSTGRSLAIDHDHNTGKVRGLLCGRCNRGLGLFEDEINILESALNYLKN